MINFIKTLATLLIATQFSFAQIQLKNGNLSEKTGLDFATNTPIFQKKQTIQFGALPAALDASFDSICNLSTLKGFSAAMILPDGTVWKRAKGVAKEIPVTEILTTEHLIGMGSITKSFVAATLLTMVDDNLLSLDDSIGKFLPPYPNVNSKATVRQLLNHRAGFYDYFNQHPTIINDWISNLDSIWAPQTILNNYVLAPNAPLDSTFYYSNTHFLLAGQIIEAIAQKPWYEALRERILVPFELTNTFAYPYESYENLPFSNVFLDIDGDTIVEDGQGSGLPMEGFFSLAGSAGNLLTTPLDIAKFSKAIHGGGFLQPATLAEMHTDYSAQYGLGTFFIDIPGLPNWGHNGDLIYKAIGFYFTEENMSLAVQQNDGRDADTDPNAVDFNTVFGTLLTTYLNYQPMVSVTNNLGSSPRLRVFPNPVSDILCVEIPENLNDASPLQLLDAMGRIVFLQTNENTQFKIPTGQLPKGIYTLRIGGLFQKVVVDKE